MNLRTFVALAGACGLGLALPACDKSSDASNAPGDAPAAEGGVPEDAPVVENTQAKPGDVTTCPYSGKKFVVKAEHPTMQWGEQTYVFCSDFAKQEVEKDPEKYLGPAS